MRTPPYLPFLAGPPAFIVGLKPIAESAWLAPDVEAHCLAEKHALLDAQYDDVFREARLSRMGQTEAALMVTRACGAALSTKEAPLAEASRYVSDDLVLMEKRDGVWVCTALSLCSPTFFSAAHALGKSLDGLHEPVPDELGPGGSQALGQRIGRVFDHLHADAILERFNWTVQAGPDRYTPSSAPLIERAVSVDPRDALDVLHLRVERQTIRRLTQTGGILFTIRVSLDPLRAVLMAARAAFEHAWRHAPPPVARYKKWAAVKDLVEGALNETAPP